MAGAKKFNFYIDQKITTWERVHFEIIASNLKDAKEQAKDIFKEELEYPDSNCIEQMSELNQEMLPEDNRGKSTKELYRDNGEKLSQNGKD